MFHTFEAESPRRVIEDRHAFDSIDGTTFDELLAQYSTVVDDMVDDQPEELEKQRLDVIPTALTARDPAFLTKPELATLMDWKLSHGKSRPALKGYIKKNTDDAVELTTKQGFATFTTATHVHDDDMKWSIATRKGLNVLTKLKGVGPATASLLLSTYAPENVTFFSDELFMWSFWEDGKGKGWDREMKYTPREYDSLCSKVHAFKGRFMTEYERDVGALDIEKVAYVLGKQATSGNVKKKRKQATKAELEERRELAREWTKHLEQSLIEHVEQGALVEALFEADSKVEAEDGETEVEVEEEAGNSRRKRRRNRS